MVFWFDSLTQVSFSWFRNTRFHIQVPQPLNAPSTYHFCPTLENNYSLTQISFHDAETLDSIYMLIADYQLPWTKTSAATK